jgi:hypothetical protein
MPRHAFLALAAAIALVAGPASAESFTVECNASNPGPDKDSMFCDTGHMMEFTSMSPETSFVIEVTAPATHCSDITYLFLRSGKDEPIAMSSRMSAGQSEKHFIGNGWEPGEHIIWIAALGHVGGCNTGEMHSWGGDVTIAPQD